MIHRNSLNSPTLPSDPMIIYSAMHNDDDDQGQHKMSRLLTKHFAGAYIDDEDNGCEKSRYMSRLSIEGSDGDGDGDQEMYKGKEGKELISDVSSDSDKELGCFSLPATPHKPRIRGKCPGKGTGVKEYASENEAEKGLTQRNKMRRNSKRRIFRERWITRAWEKKEGVVDEEGEGMMMEPSNNHSCESECLVITRPKGGRRSLCMDLEEVKACMDLGFELEHERLLEIPGRISRSCSTISTSSGSNSPITNWKISSPGDTPRDVKTRLKVWAQAVALASTFRNAT